MSRYAVVLTHNRPEMLRQTVEAIGPQVDRVIVIDNASEPLVLVADLIGPGREVCVLNVPDQPANLAHLWQLGISVVANMRDADMDNGSDLIAFLCDDAPPPADWFDLVAAGMAETGAVLGCSNPWGGAVGDRLVKTAHDQDIRYRMPGWAFVLNADSPVRPDPAMHWWYVDTDMDWQARQCGGMVMVGGCPVPNLQPNYFTATVPGLGERAGQDGQVFAAKWGQCPW